MKKVIISLFVFFLLASIIVLIVKTYNIKTSKNIYNIYKNIKQIEWLSYDIRKTVIFTTETQVYPKHHIIYNKDKIFVDTNLFCKIKIDTQTMTKIDTDKEIITFFDKDFQDSNGYENNYSLYLYNDISFPHKYNIYSPYFEIESIRINKKKDTVINNCPYTLFHTKSKIFESWDSNLLTYKEAKQTNKIWYIQYDICWFYNHTQKNIDKTVLKTIRNVKGVICKSTVKEIIYEYFNFSYDNKEQQIKDIFDIKNTKYNAYSIIDDKTFR